MANETQRTPHYYTLTGRETQYQALARYLPKTIQKLGNGKPSKQRWEQTQTTGTTSPSSAPQVTSSVKKNYEGHMKWRCSFLIRYLIDPKFITCRWRAEPLPSTSTLIRKIRKSKRKEEYQQPA
jgi:hypothetical protein